MFSKTFWLDAAERAGKTFAQNLAAPLVVAGVASIAHLNWVTITETALTTAVLSLATSVASLPVGNNGNASLVRRVHIGRHEA